MKKLHTLTGALCTMAMLFATTHLWAQLTPQVFIQSADPMNKEIVIEAENASLITDKTTGDTRNWAVVADVDASGGEALQATGGTDDSSPGEFSALLQEAKAYFYMYLEQDDDYYLYIRYKALNASSDEVYVANDFNTPIRSYFEGNTADGSYNWEMVGDLSGMVPDQGSFTGVYSVTASEIDQVATLIFNPREAGFCLDKFVLSPDNTLTATELDALTTESTNDYPDLPNNLLKYTAFEEVADELEIDLMASQDVLIVDYPGHNNYHYPFWGDKMGVLDRIEGINYPAMQFKPVNITCDYTDLEICYRWMAPAALDNAFAGMGSLDFRVLYDMGGGTTSSELLGQLTASDINTSGDSLNLKCFSLTPPIGTINLVFKVILNVTATDQDVFIGETYLTVTNGTIPTASFAPADFDDTNDPIVTFDGSNSTDATFYEWNFGDGTSSTPSMMATASHTYTSNGTFTACLSVLDACANLPDVACQEVTISDVLPVELTRFSAVNKGQNIQLSWETATELNNDYFSVEHSLDGRHFTAIGTVSGHGTTSIPQSYRFEHLRPAAGKHYYRLQQVDFDGQYEYSKVVTVDLFGGSDLEIFPNPVSGALTVNASDQIDLMIDIYHLDGRLAISRLVQSGAPIEMNQLPSGTYFVKFRDLKGNVLDYQRLIKL